MLCDNMYIILLDSTFTLQLPLKQRFNNLMFQSMDYNKQRVISVNTYKQVWIVAFLTKFVWLARKINTSHTYNKLWATTTCMFKKFKNQLNTRKIKQFMKIMISGYWNEIMFSMPRNFSRRWISLRRQHILSSAHL